MQQVQERYVSLARTLEAGLEEPKNFVARERASELRQALEHAAIRSGHNSAENPQFQQLLAETIETIEQVHVEADRFDADGLWQMRESISYRCQGCHDRFRR